MTADVRFTRQVRLAEVGDAGQARIENAVVRVHGEGMPAAIEARYLVGAGARVALEETPRADEAPPAWLDSLDPAARDVAAGSYAALTVLTAILTGAPHPRAGGSAPPR